VDLVDLPHMLEYAVGATAAVVAAAFFAFCDPPEIAVAVGGSFCENVVAIADAVRVAQ